MCVHPSVSVHFCDENYLVYEVFDKTDILLGEDSIVKLSFLILSCFFLCIAQFFSSLGMKYQDNNKNKTMTIAASLSAVVGVAGRDPVPEVGRDLGRRE